MPVRTRSSGSNSSEASNTATTTVTGTTPAATKDNENPPSMERRSEEDWWELQGAALECARDPKIIKAFEKGRDASKETMETKISRGTPRKAALKILDKHYDTASRTTLTALTEGLASVNNPFNPYRTGTPGDRLHLNQTARAARSLGPRTGRTPGTYDNLSDKPNFRALKDEDQKKCALRALDVVEKVALYFLWDVLEADLREVIVTMLLEAKIRARKCATATADEKSDLAAFNTVPTLTWWETVAAVLKGTATIAKLDKSTVRTYTSITPIRRPSETIYAFALRIHKSRLYARLYGEGWGDDAQAGLARQLFETMLLDIPDERGHWDIVVAMNEDAQFFTLLKAFVSRLATRTSTRKMSRTAITERLRRHAPDLLIFYKEIAKLVSTKQATGGKAPQTTNTGATLTPAEVKKYQKILQERYDARQCLNCGLTGHRATNCTSSPMRAVRAFSKYFFLNRTTHKICIKAVTVPEAKADAPQVDDVELPDEVRDREDAALYALCRTGSDDMGFYNY